MVRSATQSLRCCHIAAGLLLAVLLGVVEYREWGYARNPHATRIAPEHA